MSDENNNPAPDQTAEVETTETESPQVPAGYFSQEQVNAIVAREVARTKRAASKAQPKKETTTSIERMDLSEQIRAAVSNAIGPVTEQLEAMKAETHAAKMANEFMVATEGLSISESDKGMLQTLFQHNREAFDAQVKARKSVDAPPEPRGNGVSAIPAPNPTPSADRLGAPHTWSKDDVARMRADGTLLSNVKKYRDSLPGGGGGLFPAKNPGKKAG